MAIATIRPPASSPLALPLDGPRPRAEVVAELRHVAERFAGASSRMLGYQLNQDLDYAPLAEFLRFCTNNLGDPFVDSNYAVNSRDLERAVLEYAAALFDVADEPWWGYVTGGGTEANLHGLYLGRNRLEARLERGVTPRPIAYFSDDTHYSVPKAADLLRVPAQRIASDEHGRIRVPLLLDAILAGDPVEHPPLIVANVGTTFTGAYDDVEAICDGLARAGVTDYYLHVDAALGGFLLPFLARSAAHEGCVPEFDFALPISSMAVSGHKVIGAPVPCGVFLTRAANLAYGNARHIEYVGSIDSTLSGSRSGLASIALWYAIATLGTSGLIALCERMVATAAYAERRLDEAGWNPSRPELGVSVVFDRPPDWVVRKWSLSTQGERCHLYAMGHLTEGRVEALLDDLATVRRVLALSRTPADERAVDRPQLLASLDLLAGLEAEDLWRVAQVMTEREVAAGTYLAHQGDEGDEMYIVVAGEVEIIDEPTGRRTFVARPGAAIGEIAALTDLTRIATMRCRTDCQLLVLSGRDFRTLMHDLPVISTRVIETLVRRLVASP